MTDRNPIDLQRHLPSWPFIGIAAFVAGVVGAVFVYSGAYNIGADAPHTPPIAWLMQTVRERSIAVRASGLTPPADLRDPRRISAGAGLYSDMCASCHLAPGMEKTEISQGLYPPAPELSRP